MAQLPRECFYVTEIHGPTFEGADLLSDLPALTSMYKPGMRLQTVVGHQDAENEDSLTGLQVHLHDPVKKTNLELPTIGALVDEWHSRKLTFDHWQPDKIAILVDDDEGVCDVVFYKEDMSSHLAKKCKKEDDTVTEYMIRLSDEAPLVGFHGMSDSYGLTSLGLILLDKHDPVCQSPHDNANFNLYENMSIFEQSTTAEGSITQNEKDRAKALEAILKYDSMKKARESKQDIIRQIKLLNSQKPISVKDNMPASADDLKEVFDRLKEYEEEQKPISKFELKTLFDKLEAHYEDDGHDGPDLYADLDLPITWGDIKRVYDYLENNDDDAGLDEAFVQKPLESRASILDLTLLLDKLSNHYASGPGKINDLNEETDDLIDIFDDMSLFYSVDDAGKLIPQADELSRIYNTLALLFGRKSDFDMNDSQIDEIYNAII